MNLNDTTMALAGGALIGLASASWLVLTGKTAGVSGMLYGMVKPEKSESGWQASFLLGLLIGGIGLSLFWPERLPDLGGAQLWVYGVAGLLVGFGTRLGGGCTSGHGVCGIGRFSMRSIVGTCVFMATGVGAVYVFKHVVGV